MDNVINKGFKYKLIVLLGMVITGSIYVYPFFASNTSSDFPATLPGFVGNYDGTFYLLRLKSVLAGDTQLSCVIDPHLANSESIYPNTLEVLWGGILKIFLETDIISAAKATYFFLPSIIFLLFFLGFYSLSRSFLLSLGFALWASIEPGAYYWKPITFVRTDPLLYFRYANPLLISIPMILTLVLMFELFRPIKTELKKLTLLLCASLLSFSSLFLSIAYYWSLLCVGIGFYFMLSLIQKDRRQVFISGTFVALGLFLGIREVMAISQFFSDPLSAEVMNRIGVKSISTGPEFLLHKSMIFTFIIYQIVCWKSHDWKWRFFTSFTCAGWLVLNQDLITGEDAEFFHYFRPLGVIYAFILFDIVHRILTRVKERLHYPNLRWVGVILCVLIILRGFNGAEKIKKDTEEPTSFAYKVHHLDKTLHFLKNLSDQNRGALLMDPDLSLPISLKTSLPIYVVPLIFNCLISDSELFARWGIFFRAYGRSNAEYTSFINTFVEEATLPSWNFGLPQSYKGQKRAHGIASLKPKATACIDSYSKRSMVSFVNDVQIKHGLPRLALSSPSFELDLDALQTSFQVDLLKEVPDEKTKVWLLTPKPKTQSPSPTLEL